MSEKTEVLLAQYDQAIDHMELFIEWRHKLMVRMASQAGGAVVIARWFYERDTTRPRLGAGLTMLAGASLCFLTLLMEVRNARRINTCRDQVRRVERELQAVGGLNVFGVISDNAPQTVAELPGALRRGDVRYRWLVLVSNASLVGGLLALAVAAFAWPS